MRRLNSLLRKVIGVPVALLILVTMGILSVSIVALSYPLRLMTWMARDDIG